MSTLSGQASKGEKTKSKFQSLDINNLYRVSRGENTEKQQTKSSSVFIKHGMQSLGKVPSARRAPANLPSLKSEHSETGAAVPLVPPGGPGWGKQDSTSSASSATNSSTASNQAPEQQNQHQQPPVVVQQQQQNQQQPQQQQVEQQQAATPAALNQKAVSALPATTDKLWSSITSGNDPLHPPPYQSPQFQHEFPSLSAGDGVPTRTGSDAQYTSGLSLRPQTEGSWTQGGTRPGGGGGGGGPDRPLPGSAPMAVPPQLPGQVGLPPQQPLPPQFRTVLPPFMYKGNFQQPPAQGPPNLNTPPPAVNGRNRADNRPPRLTDNADELTPRPIIKEEELSRMDEIGNDMGWAIQDEIDYNQKLAFSDDESADHVPKRQERERERERGGEREREREHREKPNRERELDRSDSHSSDSSRNWNNNAPRTRGRSSEEEDLRVQRRMQHEVEIAVQRAKQRKEEEEKRFNEATKQGAHKKLKELEEKIQKRDRVTEGSGTINPSAVPPKPINHAPIPLPEFQKDKEHRETPNDPNDDKQNNFRHLTQIEGKNFPRKHNNAGKPLETRERDNRGEQSGPFSRHFQNDLPPRFMKHQRNNSNTNLQSQGQFDNNTRWTTQNPKTSPNINRNIKDSPDRTVLDEENNRREYKRQSSEDSYRSAQSDLQSKQAQQPSEDFHKQDSDEWHAKREERPQRPDSRDSRSTRHSRDSESRDYLAPWSEPAYESYEDKRKEHVREDRRSVPGPITKDRIEADDLRSEKRNLTQLKRGQILDKKTETGKPEEQDLKKKEDVVTSNAWADAIPTNEDLIEDKSTKTEVKVEVKKEDYKDRGQNRRGDNRAGKPGWGNEYHRSSAWNNKRPVGRSGHKMGGRPNSQVGGDYHCTDSEGSIDEHSERSKKMEKDEKNREVIKGDKRDYVPRGEPSRFGRGGGSFGRNSRLGGLSKKIDGYGPPPKSPFGHHDERDKKLSSDEASAETGQDDKIRQNQQALSAGIIGSNRKDYDDKNKGRKDNRRGKSRSKKDDEIYDTNSELSDEKDGKSGMKKPVNKKPLAPRGSSNSLRRNNPPPPRMGGDKRYGDTNNPVPRQNSNTALIPNKKDEKTENILCSAIADISLKTEVTEDKDEKLSINGGDSEGFQEVKSKKTGKERQKSAEDKTKTSKPDVKEKDRVDRKKSQLTPQQIQNIPPLMATPVNPPQVLPKKDFERPRQNKLAPRFAKQKLQKAQMQQQHHLHDVGDMNKVNQNINVYGLKDAGVVGSVSAWDKPLSSQMRGMDHENIIGVAIDGCKGLEGGQVAPQGAAPSTDKLIGKQIQDKTLLDGTTPPVNTIIFENTNFKSAPGSRNTRNDKPRKIDDSAIDNSVISNFNKPLTELIGKDKSDSIQLPISFKDDNADMKLDFFDSDLSHLTDEKSTKNLMKSMHTITSGNSTMCTVDSLDIKIASVKKVWETSEHNVRQDDNSSSFSNSFVTDNNLDPNVFNKTGENPDDNHEGYNQSPNQSASTTTNVCKVKPTQQVSGGGNQTVLSSTSHQPQLAMATQSLMGNPLSPPPMQHVPGAGVGLGQPQAYGTNQHIGYQTGLGGSTQFGMSAIPSPPTVSVLYNQTQPMQPANAASLYGTFPMDQASVLGGQGRSQYSQYPPYGFGQTASSPYSTQSAVYLQTAPPHAPPPPQAAQAPPPDMYQNLRLSAAAPFGQTQQLNNPSTVLITSTSNTLMSASVKPSTQQISAIGTKAGGVGQAYQQQSQQGQVYMYDPTMQANYISGMQRGGPVQNNVVTALQPSSSYYSGSTGGQTGFFQQPGNSTIPSAQMGQHQPGGYALQGFNQTHTSAGFNSHFLSTPMQMAAAAISQQYRTAGLFKNVAGQQIADQNARPQQLKSPSSQEALSSVFSGSQIPSPKSRQNCKHPPPQSSPTAQPKYLYQNMGNQQSNVPRYPTPIQRPVNFQQNLGSVQNNVNPKHRSNNMGNKAPNRQFYSGQNNSLSSQNDKVEDSKLNDNTNNTNSTKSATAAVNTTELKDNIKEETSTLKD